MAWSSRSGQSIELRTDSVDEIFGLWGPRARRRTDFRALTLMVKSKSLATQLLRMYYLSFSSETFSCLVKHFLLFWKLLLYFGTFSSLTLSWNVSLPSKHQDFQRWARFYFLVGFCQLRLQTDLGTLSDWCKRLLDFNIMKAMSV